MHGTAVVVFGVGMSLFVLLLLFAALISFKNTLRDRHVRRVSLVSLALPIVTLGCIAVLNNAALIGAESIEPRVALQWVIFAVIPVCVIVASACAASYLEPLVIAAVLILVPVTCDFMPNLSGSRNPVWHPGAVVRDWGLAENLLVLLAVLIVPTAVIGFGALFVSRKLRAGQWVWSIVRGLAWGLPCGVGVLFAVKSKMALDIAFGGDYTMVWVILGTVVAISAIAGLKRNPHTAQRQPQQGGGMGNEAPLASASTDRTQETNVMDQGSSGTAMQSASDQPVPHQRRMVSGAKAGLALLCLYVAFIGSILLGQSWWDTFHRYVGTSTSGIVGYGLLFGLPILVGIAGLITGIQKKRPGIGVLALLTTPIGFLFALAAENRSGADASSSPFLRKRPIGVTFVGSALMVLAAFRLLTTFVPITANNHILRMLSMSFTPVDPRDVYWMASSFRVWPSGFWGGSVFGYGSLIATLLIGVFLLGGIRLARWFYLGWGAFGILAAFSSLYFPPGYIIIRVLIYVAFTVVLFRKRSSEFFSRRQR